jgi:magnesium transporter
VTVGALDDQELVASRIAKYNLLAVPVLEKDGSVVGFVTVDDVIDVMIEEGTEDVLRMAAIEPGAMDEPYAATPFWSLIRKRAGWLLILFLSEMLTATAMGRFEGEIARAVVLALFQCRQRGLLLGNRSGLRREALQGPLRHGLLEGGDHARFLKLRV